MKTTLVSPMQLKRYQNQLIAIGVFILLMSIITGLRVFDGDYMLLFVIPMFFIIPISIYRVYTKMRCIAYSEHSLYFGTAKSPELRKVSFDNIRSVHVGKFDRIYKINFAEAIDDIKAVHFKPSPIWAPFSNIKDEKKVRRLCDAVNAHLGIADPDQQLHVYQMSSVI